LAFRSEANSAVNRVHIELTGYSVPPPPTRAVLVGERL